MHSPKNLHFSSFDNSENPLLSINQCPQSKYINGYLKGLNAKTVLCEPNYFDRDYLSEFSAFYSTSAKGYENICIRLHFFSSSEIDRDLFESAAGGNSESIATLQKEYLGFCVIRPIPTAPFGRTVLKWYPDKESTSSRVMKPSRNYTCNIAGLTLTVNGLAWQQQDSAVGACATIGLWTMLHSSAFDARHSIPTTTDITRSANKSVAIGRKIFPSHYLTIEQMLEAIKDQLLTPIVFSGDLPGDTYVRKSFSKQRFASTLAALIRSGYPVLIVGAHKDPDATVQHLICAVGFREKEIPATPPSSVIIQDESVDYIYINDDNIGPGARFIISEEEYNVNKETFTRAVINRSPPDYVEANIDSAITFIPDQMIVAVHEEIRISPDDLHYTGYRLTENFYNALKAVLAEENQESVSLEFSIRFFRINEYLGDELTRHFEGSPELLSKTRLSLQEEVHPMSLFIGVIRIATFNGNVLIDTLYDTSDLNKNHTVFAHIIFYKEIDDILNQLTPEQRNHLFGTAIKSF